MKEQEVMYKKVNGKLVPCSMDAYFLFLHEVKEGETLRASFKVEKESKSAQQMRYLYGVVYPFCLYWFRETRGEVLYENEILGQKVPVKATKESVDFLFKTLFAMYKGEEVSKGRMTMEEMSEYIDFIDKWSIEHFGHPIPDARQD